MSKKKQTAFSADSFGTETKKVKTKNLSESKFYFGKENYKWMLIGLGLIVLGFVLMMGPGANTRPDGVVDPTYWNEDIFSIRRIRIAPLLILAGFVVQVYAILKKKN